jgi:hypothetical protein
MHVKGLQDALAISSVVGLDGGALARPSDTAGSARILHRYRDAGRIDLAE